MSPRLIRKLAVGCYIALFLIGLVISTTYGARAQIVDTVVNHPHETITVQAIPVAGLSLVEEHSTEVVGFLIWAIIGLGTAFLGLLTWIVLIQYNAIKSDIKRLDQHVKTELTDIRLRVHTSELELANLKTSCRIYHGGDRRKVDLFNLKEALAEGVGHGRDSSSS